MCDCSYGGLPYVRLLANVIRVERDTFADIRRIEGEMARVRAVVASAIRQIDAALARVG